MELTIGHVYHALEFVEDSLEKIAPINYSQKMGDTEPKLMSTFAVHHRLWFLCRRCAEVRQRALSRCPQQALGLIRYIALIRAVDASRKELWDEQESQYALHGKEAATE